MSASPPPTPLKPPTPDAESSVIFRVGLGAIVAGASVVYAVGFGGWGAIAFGALAVGAALTTSGVMTWSRQWPLSHIRLVIPETPLRAGEDVELELRLIAKRPTKFVAGNLNIESSALVRLENDDGYDETFRQTLGTSSAPVQLPPLVSGQVRLKIPVRVPDAALPTYKNDPKQFVTECKVELQFENAYLERTSATLMVGADRVYSRPAGVSNAASGQSLELSLDDGLCWPGGTLQGRVTVKSSEANAGLRVVLMPVATLNGKGGAQQLRLPEAELPVAPTAETEHTFAIPIGANFPLSFQGEHFEILWKLTARLQGTVWAKEQVELPFRMIHKPVDPAA